MKFKIINLKLGSYVQEYIVGLNLVVCNFVKIVVTFNSSAYNILII